MVLSCLALCSLQSRMDVLPPPGVRVGRGNFASLFSFASREDSDAWPGATFSCDPEFAGPSCSSVVPPQPAPSMRRRKARELEWTFVGCEEPRLPPRTRSGVAHNCPLMAPEHPCPPQPVPPMPSPPTGGDHMALLSLLDQESLVSSLLKTEGVVKERKDVGKDGSTDAQSGGSASGGTTWCDAGGARGAAGEHERSGSVDGRRRPQKPPSRPKRFCAQLLATERPPSFLLELTPLVRLARARCCVSFSSTI